MGNFTAPLRAIVAGLNFRGAVCSFSPHREVVCCVYIMWCVHLYCERKSTYGPSELMDLLFKQRLRLLDHVGAPGDKGSSRERPSDGHLILNGLSL